MSNSVFEASEGKKSGKDELPQDIITLEQLQECQNLIELIFLIENKFDAKDWKNIFSQYITEEKLRILYSIVSASTYNYIIENKDISYQDEIENRLKLIFPFLKSDEERKVFLKLYDHINLCIQQANFISNSYSKEITSLKSQLKTAHTNINLASDKIEALTNTSKKTQREYVAVLGIFTAVILSFVSGSMFLNSSLNNVHQVDFWRVSFTSISVGMILLNILIALFIFIKKIVQDDDKFPKLSLWLNGVMLFLLGIVGLCWHLDVGDFDKNITFIKENKEHLQNHPHIKVFESQKHK